MKKPRTLKRLLAIYDYSRARLMKKGTDKARSFWREQVNRLKYLDQPYLQRDHKQTTNILNFTTMKTKSNKIADLALIKAVGMFICDDQLLKAYRKLQRALDQGRADAPSHELL